MSFLEYCEKNAPDALNFTRIDMELAENFFIKENEEEIKSIFIHAVDFAQNATNNESFLDFFSMQGVYKSFEFSLAKKIPQEEFNKLSRIQPEELLDILEAVQVYSIISVKYCQNHIEKFYEEFDMEKMALFFNTIITVGYILASLFIRYKLEKQISL